MAAKIISISDSAKNRIRQVDQARNEEDLKTKWLVPILQTHFHIKQDEIHYEKQVLKGRVDVRLMHAGRTRGAIELKAPTISLDRDSHSFDTYFMQAHKYAHAFYVWRKGQLFPVQGVLTNGHVAWVFDGGLPVETSKATARKINLTDDEGYRELYGVIESMKDAEPHVWLQRPLERNAPTVASADNALAKVLIGWYIELYKRVKNREDSLDLTLQLYLIAICRDCGFVPTKKIAQYESQNDWGGIVRELDKLFSYKFITLPKEEHAYLWSIYNQTRTVPVRLDTFPPDALGTVYEKVVRKIKGAKGTKTSFYTPMELVEEILDSIKLKKTDRVLDPTAGSAAFLVACIQKLFPKETDYKIVKKYIEDNLVGIDIDPYACIIGKASVLSAYATTLPYDPVDNLKIPSVSIFCHDFFDKKALQYGKFDVVLGNPPWGSIDSKKVLNNPVVKATFNSSNYAVYKDKSDICIYVYERAFNLLSARGRIGMVCKQQTTSGKQHEKFVDWWTNRVSKIVDFGDEKLFNNEAQTAIIIGSRKAKGRPKYIEKSKAPAIEFKGKRIGKYFWTTQGWQSGNDPLYSEFARLYPGDASVMDVLKNKSACYFNIKRSEVSKISVIVGDDKASNRFRRWVDKNHPALKTRKGCSAKYGWKRTFHKDKFKFDGTQIRLVIPRVWSRARIPAVIDRKGELASITSLTVLIPKPGTPIEIIFLTAAWISSAYFHQHARNRRRCKLMGNGGLAMYPAYIEKCLLPEWKNRSAIAKRVQKVLLTSSQPSEAELHKIDELFLESLRGLKAKGIESVSTKDQPGTVFKHASLLKRAKAARDKASRKSTKKSRRA